MSRDLSSSSPSSDALAAVETPIEFRDRVLKFWFGLSQQQWFAGGEEVDAMIEERFADVLPRVRSGAFDSLHEIDAHSSLALIIALDQFPRNLCRGSPESFTSDAKARGFVHSGIAKGHLEDFAGDKDKIMFYTLPLMHSEVLADHDTLEEIYDKFEMPNREFAADHRFCIATFGRFPYRNAAMSRACTPEEDEYLKSKATSG
jgi:uncharacterized protein (DUF924 family)